MNKSYYTYRIRISNLDTIHVEKRDSESNVMGEPTGKFRYEENKADIQKLQAAAREGTLLELGVRELGKLLFDTLLDEKLRYDFFTLYEYIRREKALLRIELDVDERHYPDVAAWPWECMFVPEEAGYGTIWLGTDPNIIFSRRRALWRVPEPIRLAQGERLRIAVVVSEPVPTDNLGKVAYKAVWNALQDLANNQPDRIELLPLVQDATTAKIDDVLEQAPHILHFMGHARLQNEQQQDMGEVALVDDITREVRWANASLFGSLFGRHTPGIVLLHACEGAALSETKAFVGVASQVVQQNIPVVAAMQYPVSNATAQRFALEFYERLSKDEPVDKAVQEGRRRIALTTWYKSLDFATPVLFMRTPDGHLFERPVAQTQYGYLSDPSTPSTRSGNGSMQEGVPFTEDETYEAFMLYTEFDNKHNSDVLAKMCEGLSSEVQAQTGTPFRIFQDMQGVKWGQINDRVISKVVEKATFLIPIITPSFFKNDYCRRVLDAFIQREKEHGRYESILPVYFMTYPMLEDRLMQTNDYLVREIGMRRPIDWRDLRFSNVHSLEVRRMLAEMAFHISDMMRRSASLR